MRTHPFVTALLAGGLVALLVVSALIGLPIVITVGLSALVGAIAVLLWRIWLRGWQVTERSPTTAGRLGVVAVALAGAITFVAIQFVPYGRAHTNGPITGEPLWADATTRELMVDACFACHSNEVDYPPLASVAPISWIIERDVTAGRDEVNYSEFATDPRDADESLEVVREREMPPSPFTRFGQHPEANLDDAELAALLDGLRRTPGLHDG